MAELLTQEMQLKSIQTALTVFCDPILKTSFDLSDVLDRALCSVADLVFQLDTSMLDEIPWIECLKIGQLFLMF